MVEFALTLRWFLFSILRIDHSTSRRFFGSGETTLHGFEAKHCKELLENDLYLRNVQKNQFDT